MKRRLAVALVRLAISFASPTLRKGSLVTLPA